MSLEVNIEKNLDGFTLRAAFSAGNTPTALLGASGCGKSMALRCIAGIVKPDKGRIVLDGRVLFDSEQHIDLPPQQRGAGLLFQNYALFPNMTVEQNILCGLKAEKDRAARQARCAELLRAMRLEPLAKRYPAQLSGGQQQRVALARMLAARPGILMLDEPFSALDSHLKSVLEQNLVDLFEAFEGTILYVSHDIDEALRFCDRIAVVDDGHILEVDTGDELVNAPQSEAALKLSGCKNTTPVIKADEHSVWAPKWGVRVECNRSVPDSVRCLGVRAFYLERASGPGTNNYRVRVDRISDSRFERSALLGFLDRDDSFAPAVERSDDEMKFLHQHLFWRVDKLKDKPEDWPEMGEELWVHLPQEKIYLVSR